MNKYQKALNKLKIIGDKDLYNEKHIEWTNTLQELVDKATPKKVDKYRRNIKLEPTYFCPVCENIVEKEQKYCAECGQRLE